MPIAQKLPSTAWPDGSTWVFQGTVAEDATAGTHVCTLTVTPGVGNELLLDEGSIIVGNTATAQIASVRVTDGTNLLYHVMQPSGTTANLEYSFPVASATGSSGGATGGGSVQAVRVTGAMQLILQVTTAAVSVTQTFAVVCRLRSPKKPTATLLDTIGTSTNTVNTNAIFG